MDGRALVLVRLGLAGLLSAALAGLLVTAAADVLESGLPARVVVGVVVAAPLLLGVLTVGVRTGYPAWCAAAFAAGAGAAAWEPSLAALAVLAVAGSRPSPVAVASRREPART